MHEILRVCYGCCRKNEARPGCPHSHCSMCNAAQHNVKNAFRMESRVASWKNSILVIAIAARERRSGYQALPREADWNHQCCT